MASEETTQNNKPVQRRPEKNKQAPILDAHRLTIRRDTHGRLAITMPDGQQYTGARLYPAFPISRRRRFVYLYSEDNTELGLLEDPRVLDAESRDLVINECDQVFFMPRITRIDTVSERNGIARWRVETDRGPISFQVIARSDSVWYVGYNRLLVRDADGNRYMIPDLAKLDKRSRMIAEMNI
jgi:hypothetical protein